MPNRYSLLLATLLPLAVLAQQADSLFSKRVVYKDYLYLNNIYRGSENPTAISRESLSEVSEIKAVYGFSNGNYRALDAANIQKSFDFSLYGIKKLNKVSFEGDITYSNLSERNKRWNSTLYLANDNPFIIADSISSNFSTEKFALNGGVSYAMNERLHLGLRARYNVGSTANQTDPRPKVDGMRFVLNPGVDYQIGSFTIGASGKIGWMSESAEYTVVRTTDGTHYVFLFHGLGDPIMKGATGYRRRYTGTTGGGNLQFGWRKDNMQNFLELGYSTSSEDTEDSGTAEKYKGGKYQNNGYTLANRFMIQAGYSVHNINLKVLSAKVDGTTYEQEQRYTSDGNLYWDVISSSICHKSTTNNISLEYRYDKLSTEKAPHLTLGLKGGLSDQKVNHYPELYLQKYSQLYAEVFAKRSLSIKRYTFNINARALYAHRLSDSNVIDGTVLEDKYSTPQFEFASGNNVAASLKAEVLHPIKLSSLNSILGGFAEYTYKSYAGDYSLYKNTSRQNIRVGIQLIF